MASIYMATSSQINKTPLDGQFEKFWRAFFRVFKISSPESQTRRDLFKCLKPGVFEWICSVFKTIVDRRQGTHCGCQTIDTLRALKWIPLNGKRKRSRSRVAHWEKTSLWSTWTGTQLCRKDIDRKKCNSSMCYSLFISYIAWQWS